MNNRLSLIASVMTHKRLSEIDKLILLCLLEESTSGINEVCMHVEDKVPVPQILKSLAKLTSAGYLSWDFVNGGVLIWDEPDKQTTPSKDVTIC